MSEEPGLRERDGALVENWYVACTSAELGRKKPLGRTIYERDLVLFRDRDGAARCLPDRCLHRHAPLSAGVVVGGELCCPYHGWVYDGAGRVVAVPSEGARRRESADCPQLPAIPTVEQDGLVWIYAGDGAPTHPAPPFRMPRLVDEGWAHYYMVTEFANEVTHLVENFMDVPHTVFVHRGWFRRRCGRPVPIVVEAEAGEVLVTYRQAKDEIGFTGRLLNPRAEPMTHTDRFIMPNLTRVDYGFGTRRSFIILSQCTPVRAFETRVYTLIAYELGLLTPYLRRLLGFYTRRVIEQDVNVMALQGRNLRRDLRWQFHHTAADAVHLAIEARREAGARGAPLAGLPAGRSEAVIWI